MKRAAQLAVGAVFVWLSVLGFWAWIQVLERLNEAVR